jgi:LacI family transcriptional regulator
MVAKSVTEGGRAARLKDVAARVGLDTSTVSKVLNGSDISVRTETRERIMRAAEELGYRPNAHARSLRLQSTGAFGMLLPDITNPVYATIVRGAVHRASAMGVSLLLAEASEVALEETYQRLVLEKRIDGLIVATARTSGTLSRRLASDSIPHVFVNRRASGPAPSIVVNDEQGAGLAAETLAGLGHVRIGMIAGPPDLDTAQRRLVGFQQRLGELHLAPAKVVRADFTAAGGYEGMSRLMSRRRPPSAIFASNLLTGLGALKAAADEGIRVPLDVSIIAFDDDGIAAFTVPALTGIRMPYEEMGSRSVEALQQVIAGHSCPDIVIETSPRLVHRESLAPATTRLVSPVLRDGH